MEDVTAGHDWFRRVMTTSTKYRHGRGTAEFVVSLGHHGPGWTSGRVRVRVGWFGLGGHACPLVLLYVCEPCSYHRVM